MIYPTRRAVLLMAAGAPLALAAGLVAQPLWVAGLAWIVVVLAMMAVDGWLSPARDTVDFALTAPGDLATTSTGADAFLRIAFDLKSPARVEGALGVNAKLVVTPDRVQAATRADGPATLAFRLSPVRRGEGVIERAWARWTGPLGLLHRQVSRAMDRPVRVSPDLAAVREEAMRLFARNALAGQKSRPMLGEGFEFEALREYEPGMDPRAIDWKQSARHGMLLGKEFRIERNHPVMLVLDSGRLMGEPVGGAPKLDRALNAALLMAYVGLAVGDRVGLCAFDGRPRLVGRPVSGARAFSTLRRLATQIDYSTEETNFTLGLNAVSGALDRRALVVVFTDFADTTTAGLMLDSARRMSARHLLLFVLFEDEELEGLGRRAPQEPADVSRAVVADGLLRERARVVASLRRMGVEVIEAPFARVGPSLVDRYLVLKRQDRL